MVLFHTHSKFKVKTSQNSGRISSRPTMPTQRGEQRCLLCLFLLLVRTASLFQCVIVVKTCYRFQFQSLSFLWYSMTQSTDTPIDEALLHSVDQILSDQKEYLLSKITLSSSNMETRWNEDGHHLTPSGTSAGVWDAWPHGWPPLAIWNAPFRWGSSWPTFCLRGLHFWT